MRHSFLLLVALSAPLSAKVIKIHGYVTSITSPTKFEIEDYRIWQDQDLVIEFDKDEGAELDFRPSDLRVGTELEIQGDLTEATGELRARRIKVFFTENQKVKRTALIEAAARLDPDADGWKGVIHADGQAIRIDSSCKVILKGIPGGAIPANTVITYLGRRQKDGAVLASTVELAPREVGKGEQRFLAQFTPKVRPGSLAKDRPTEVQIGRFSRHKLVSNEFAQRYITRLGTSLIPAYQRNLPPGDPSRMDFRFFLIQDKSFNAHCAPNGVVMVNSGVFSVLKNEAQLAAVIGHEIAHATQMHMYRETQYHKKKLLALRVGTAVASAYGKYDAARLGTMIEAAIRNGYTRSLENQADRIGVEYMMAAGYDPRQAPEVWKAVTAVHGDQPTDVFWSNHDNNTTRRSYLMAELRNNYAEVNFDSFKENSTEFDQLSLTLKSNLKSKGHVRVISQRHHSTEQTVSGALKTPTNDKGAPTLPPSNTAIPSSVAIPPASHSAQTTIAPAQQEKATPPPTPRDAPQSAASVESTVAQPPSSQRPPAIPASESTGEPHHRAGTSLGSRIRSVFSGAPDRQATANATSAQAPAEEAIPPALQLSSITILSQPAGASIYVDDYPAGRTPTVVKLRPGKYKVTLRSSGFQPWTQELIVESDQVRSFGVELVGNAK